MVKNKASKVIVVVGPTASGKSGLGIFLVRKFGGEIISADSRQVYRGMDIGTGKVSKKEQRIAKHHLLDVADPKKIFTVSDFKKLGQKAIDDIVSRHKLPIIVGGTGFYIDVLLGRLAIAEVPPNPKLRSKLEKQSVENLYKRLKKLDPKRVQTIDPKNKRRLIRALEIIDSIGRVPYLNTKYEIHNTKYDVLWLGLKPKSLEKRIKERLEKRFKPSFAKATAGRQGMVKEVKNLLKKGVSKKRLYDFGLEYRWVGRYLNKKVNYKEMKEGLLRDIIKYSKRQMTWFKRNKEIHWIKNPVKASGPRGFTGRKEAEKLIRKFLASRP